jgi:hypothetical protein
MIGSALGGSQSWGMPAGFDVAGFPKLRKRNFITLQAAWDKADMATAALHDDRRHAGRDPQASWPSAKRHGAGQPNQTDVVMLEAQLLGIEDLWERLHGQRRVLGHDPRGAVGRPQPVPRGLEHDQAQGSGAAAGWWRACRRCSKAVYLTGPCA